MFLKKNKLLHIPQSYDNIDVVDSKMYFGMKVDSDFNFKEHTKVTCSKTSQRIQILRTIKPLLTKLELSQICDGLIVSIFRYHAPLFVCLQNPSLNIDKVLPVVTTLSAVMLATIYNKLRLNVFFHVTQEQSSTIVP